MAAVGRSRPAKPDSDHTGTISITIEVRQTCRNAMKPRFQRVVTPWKSGFMASGAGLTFMINLG